MRTLKGYDGNTILVGDRVELHPGCDLWMRGARFGTVREVEDEALRVRVHVDKVDRVVTLGADRVRRLMPFGG